MRQKMYCALQSTRCRSVPAQMDWLDSDEERMGEGILKAMSFSDFADVPAISQVSPVKRRRWGLLLLIVAVILALLQFRWPGQDTPTMQGDFAAEGRSYLKEGSVYQNDYMTLWNVNNVAISVTLKMQDRRPMAGAGRPDLSHFELRIQNLNSKGGGNDGWFAVRGSFALKPLDTEGRFFSIWPDPHGKDNVVVDFDESNQDGATVLRKLGGAGMMKFLQLKVDATKDMVLVKPKARLLRALWDQPVSLRLTTEDGSWRLWKPELPEAEEV
eukprot:g21541.t1